MLVVHTLLPVLQKQVWDQTGLQNKFQNSQDYTEKNTVLVCVWGGGPHKFMVLQFEDKFYWPKNKIWEMEPLIKVRWESNKNALCMWMKLW